MQAAVLDCVCLKCWRTLHLSVCPSHTFMNTFLEIPSAAWISFGVLLSPKDKDPPFASIAWSTFSTPSEILATAPSGRSETSTCVRVYGLRVQVHG